jgi:peptidoglycan/xylan/chitin deacetylase (PgdA/CDA1 family)
VAALVPILLYHSVADDPPAFARGYSVTPSIFAEHLDALVARGLVGLTVSGLVDAFDRRDHALVARAVAITFDDGLADFATSALPALRQRGLPSTMFVVTGCLGGGKAPPTHPTIAGHTLRWSQLADLTEEGVEVGGHSHSHPQLDTLSTPAARDEIRRCTASLEDALGEPVASFAYPHGYSSARVRDLVRDAGYRAACGVKDTLSSPADDRFALARLMLRADTPTSQVERWLDRLDTPEPATRETARTRGWRMVRRGRALITGRRGTDPAWRPPAAS